MSYNKVLQDLAARITNRGIAREHLIRAAMSLDSVVNELDLCARLYGDVECHYDQHVCIETAAHAREIIRRLARLAAPATPETEKDTDHP